MNQLNTLIEGEITLVKRLYAIVLLLRAWVVWLLVIVFQVALLGILAALLNTSTTGEENIVLFPVLAQSKALIAYMRGNAEPLKRYVAVETQAQADRARRRSEPAKWSYTGSPEATWEQTLRFILFVVGFGGFMLIVIVMVSQFFK